MEDYRFDLTNEQINSKIADIRGESPAPNYVENISEAWKLVEDLCKEEWAPDIYYGGEKEGKPKWTCYLIPEEVDAKHIEAEGETASLAISIAWLAAKLEKSLPQ